MKLFFAFAVFSLAVGNAGARKLQILHTSDMESDFQDSNTLEDKVNYYSALTAGLRQLAEKEGASSIHVTAGDNTLPGPFYQAASEVESLGYPGAGDVSIFNALSMTALGIGNHGFDGGANEYCTMVASQAMPSLSVNLDFDKLVCSPALTISLDAQECSSVGGSVAKSCFVTLDDGSKVGLIGRAPAEFFNVIENPTETLPGLDFVGGRDADNQPLLSATPMVLEQVDLLEEAGSDIIILLDHAQDWTTDPLAAEELRGIDVIVQAGGTGYMVGEQQDGGVFNMIREDDMPSQEHSYPVTQTDSEGNQVLIVNTEQLWKYIGHLMVEFDDQGHVIGYDERSGPISTTELSVNMLSEYLGLDQPLAPITEVANTLLALKDTDAIVEGYSSVGSTDVALNGERADVRGRETNLGRLAADSSVWGAQKYLNDNVIDAKIDIALKNGGGLRATIEGPEITRIAIQKALAFDNKLAVVQVSVPQLLAIFENAVSRVPAADGRFPQVAGMTIGFDQEMPGVEGQTELSEVSRITDLSVGDNVLVENGAVVGDLDQSFIIATNSFLLTGGDGYVAFQDGESIAETDIGEQAILEGYISDMGSSVSIPDPPPNARVFQSSQKEETVDAPSPDTETTESSDPPMPPNDEPKSSAIYNYGSIVSIVASCLFVHMGF